MKPYLRAPFIAALFVLGIALAFTSTTTRYELHEETMYYTVPAGEQEFVRPLELPPGRAHATCELQAGVRVYLLSREEYSLYAQGGELPAKCLDHENERLVVESPSYVLIQNDLDRDVYVELHVEVYEAVMPYAILAIPAYALTLMAVILLFVRFIGGLEEEVTTRGSP